jgi:signal transduction histidine kinase
LFVLLSSFISTLLAGMTFIAVFNVAVRRRWPTAVLFSVAMVAIAWPSLFIYPSEKTSAGTTMIAVALTTFAFTGWGMFIRARRELVANLRERATMAEADRQLHVDRARRLERERIAREMHDVLAHRLSLLAVHAGALEYRQDASPDEIRDAIAIIRTNARGGLNELRSIVHVLRETEPESGTAPPQPTLGDVPALVEESRDTGTNVELVIDVRNRSQIEDQVGRTAYRVIQEGLTNARKHAPGAGVSIDVRGNELDGLDVSVITPLPVNRPADIAPLGAGTGLIGLAERARLVGGRFEQDITSAGEFRIGVWLPWKSASE